MSFEVFSKIVQCALEWFHRPGRERAEGVPRPKKLRMQRESLHVNRLPVSVFNRLQDLRCPRQTFSTRRAPTTRLLCKEMFKVVEKSDWARLIVHDDHRSRTRPASRFLHRLEIHLHVEMLLQEKFR